jgi:alkylation response protein AidB-like acyl-CoA dehydrogenase
VTEGEGVAALEACRDRAIAALCAEAVGAMTELNSATLEYSKRASSSGRARDVSGAAAPHGRHVHRARRGDLAHAASEPQPRGRGAEWIELASGAKTKVGYAARFVAEQAVQLHGGMGMSDELNVGHYFKRINSINVQFGDPTYHLMRYAQQTS